MQKMLKIPSNKYSNVTLKAIPGHFVTPNSHVNYFLDMTTMKSRLSEASAAARALGMQIDNRTVIDTIVCIDGCEIIGAYLAKELTKAGNPSTNLHQTIYIITPEYLNSGQMLFRENLLPMIKEKNVLLLLASATTGQTISKASQVLTYYGAKISGISAVFSASHSLMGVPIKALFTIADLPEYKAYNPEGCALCREGISIDAFANGYGYSRI